MQRRLEHIGGTLQPSKCEVVPTAPGSTTVTPQHIPGMAYNYTGHFEILGALIRDPVFCNQWTAEKARQARELLLQVASVKDIDAALHIIRQCFSTCKLAYAMRIVSLGFHALALQEFDVVLGQALEGLLQEPLPNYVWAQAQLSIAHGGFGLRLAVLRSLAAYLASLAAVLPQCNDLDIGFDAQDSAGKYGWMPRRLFCAHIYQWTHMFL
eukprot:2425388-Amphidinium_carterae.1